MDDSDREYLKLRGEILDEVKEVAAERDSRIREILQTRRASVTEVMEVTGLSRQRVYQIRNVGIK